MIEAGCSLMGGGEFHFVLLSLIRIFDSVGNTPARQSKISFCFALAYSYF